MKARGWEIMLGFIVLLILLVVLSTSCMFAGKPRTEVIIAPPMNDMLGFTTCNGNRPLVVIRSGLRAGDLVTVLQHEEIHVSQMKRFPTCKDFARLYTNNADFRLKMELEAYCPEARAVALITEKDSVARRLSTHLILTTGTLKSLPKVESMVLKECLR